MGGRRRVTLGATLLLLAALGGCRDPVRQAPAGTVASREAQTPEQLQADAKYYTGRGVVRDVNREGLMITIEHQGIEGFMPAPALVTFLVDNAELLANIEVGDVVDFVIEHSPAFTKVVEINEAVLPVTPPRS